MKKQFVFAQLATLAVLLGTTAVHAQSTEVQTVQVSIQNALQSPTGFMTGGQVQVTGVGQGSVVLERAAANIALTGGATASSNNLGSGIPASQSSMITTFDFDRTVETAAALVGVGTVVAQGESLGGVGIVGLTQSNATRAGTFTDINGDSSAGSASVPTSAQGSMVADFSTSNTMQLGGTGSLFAGAQTLTIGERNAGVSAGITGEIEASDQDIIANTLDADFVNFNSEIEPVAQNGVTVDGFGSGFFMTSILRGDSSAAPSSTIDMNVSNAGNGSVLVSASTGGFFTEGTASGITVAPTFPSVGGFFTVN